MNQVVGWEGLYQGENFGIYSEEFGRSTSETASLQRTVLAGAFTRGTRLLSQSLPAIFLSRSSYLWPPDQCSMLASLNCRLMQPRDLYIHVPSNPQYPGDAREGLRLTLAYLPPFSASPRGAMLLVGVAFIAAARPVKNFRGDENCSK